MKIHRIPEVEDEHELCNLVVKWLVNKFGVWFSSPHEQLVLFVAFLLVRWFFFDCFVKLYRIVRLLGRMFCKQVIILGTLDGDLYFGLARGLNLYFGVDFLLS